MNTFIQLYYLDLLTISKVKSNQINIHLIRSNGKLSKLSQMQKWFT